MLNDVLKKRLAKDRARTSITLRIPVDVVNSLKAIAPRERPQETRRLQEGP